MKCTYLCFLFIGINLTFIYGQQQDHVLIKRNNIKEVLGYVVNEANDRDSFLITHEFFNKMGRRTKIKVYKSNGSSTEYEYNYKDDTLCTERITRLGSKSIYTKIYYDKKNREVRAVDFDANDNKSGTFSKIKYNDRKRTKETKIYVDNKLKVRNIETYDEGGQFLNVGLYKNGKKHWSGLGNVKSENIVNYNNQGLDLVKRTRVIKNNVTMLGLIGPINIVQGDELIDEQYYQLNGLLDYEKQYLNSKCIATKKYHYVKSTKHLKN